MILDSKRLEYINFKFNIDNLFETKLVEKIKISKKTLKSLNIIDCKNSIYKIINQTSTNIGKNFLLHNIKQPIYNNYEILNRIDTIALLVENKIIMHLDLSVYIFDLLLDIFIVFTIFAIYIYVLFRFFIHRYEELGLVKFFKIHLIFLI